VCTLTIRVGRELTAWLEDKAAKTAVSQEQIVLEQLERARCTEGMRRFMSLAGSLPPERVFQATNLPVFVRAMTAFTCLALILAAAAGNGRASTGVSASKGSIELPTYPWAPSKHPYFRGTDKVNIYPYPMLDFLSREKTNRTYKTVVLENKYLRVTFLPELGGKITR